jgi:hypothetical protein
MISFIVPAHNEEAWVGRCVSAIHTGAEFLGEPALGLVFLATVAQLLLGHEPLLSLSP